MDLCWCKIQTTRIVLVLYCAFQSLVVKCCLFRLMKFLLETLLWMNKYLYFLNLALICSSDIEVGSIKHLFRQDNKKKKDMKTKRPKWEFTVVMSLSCKVFWKYALEGWKINSNHILWKLKQVRELKLIFKKVFQIYLFFANLHFLPHLVGEHIIHLTWWH